MLRVEYQALVQESRIIAIPFAVCMRRTVFDDLPCHYFDKFFIAVCAFSLVAESDKGFILFHFFFIEIVTLVDKVGNFDCRLIPFQRYGYRFSRFLVLFTETDTLAVVHFVDAVRTAAPADSILFTQKANKILLIRVLLILIVNAYLTAAYVAPAFEYVFRQLFFRRLWFQLVKERLLSARFVSAFPYRSPFLFAFFLLFGLLFFFVIVVDRFFVPVVVRFFGFIPIFFVGVVIFVAIVVRYRETGVNLSDVIGLFLVRLFLFGIERVGFIVVYFDEFGFRFLRLVGLSESFGTG